MNLTEQLAKTKKDAHIFAVSPAPKRQAVLSNIAFLLNERREEIKKINKIDINNAENMDLSSAMIDRQLLCRLLILHHCQILCIEQHCQ